MGRRFVPIAGLLIIAGALLFLFLQQQNNAGRPPEGEPARVGESGTLFTDASGGYSVTCPPGWTLSDNTRANHMIRADITRGSDTGLQIRLHNLNGAGFESYARSYVDDFARDMRDHWGGSISELERRDTKLGAHRCYIVAFRASRPNGEEWFLKEYLVPHGNKVVAFQCGAKMAEREKYEPAFDSVVESLGFAR